MAWLWADKRQIRLVRGLEQLSESVRGSLQKPPFDTKQQVLRLVADRIVAEDTKVVVHYVVPPAQLGCKRGIDPNPFPNCGADFITAGRQVQEIHTGTNRDKISRPKWDSAPMTAGHCVP